uniref:GPS domain-containing protein n=1 Tax=Parascaris univalens TaxID=6257 RepID=A0A914ZUJ1_PARUN
TEATFEKEPYEVRIYEGAVAGSKMTMSKNLERRIMGLRNCFGQLETNITWIEFNSEKWVFETRGDIVSPSGDTSRGTLHLFCAANMMHSIDFRIHVTRKNRHPPQFSQSEYRFCLPISLQKQMPFGTIIATDHDAVIYNSQVQLSVLDDGAEAVFKLLQNGTLLLTGDTSLLPVFKPLRYTILAVDFGSPQLFALANLTVVPVSVSEPRDVSVNMATTEYQIFEWDNPEYGIADKFIVSISHNSTIRYEREVDGGNNIALVKIPLEGGSGYSLQVTAVDVDGETPSKALPFTVTNTGSTCQGDCSKGGMPICYHGRFQKIMQYRDMEGPHCSCYHGYSGNVCDVKERCSPETSVNVFGHVEWESQLVNETAAVPCPFGAEGDFLRRLCMWDVSRSTAVWQPLSGDEACRKQSSVLIHLGVIGNYAQSAVSVSGIETVYRFVSSLLKMPAFEPNITNVHIDIRIAEHVAQVLDVVIARDWQNIRGNTTEIQMKMLSLIGDFSRRLPVPYKLTSAMQGVAIQTLQRLPDERAFRLLISFECGVRLPLATHASRIRAICMRNSTLQPTVDSANPLLSIEDETADGHQQIQVELRPFTEDINFTCVRFDEKANGWTTSNVLLISHNQDGFVICNSEHSGLFALVPRSMFPEDFKLSEGGFSISLPALTATLTITSCLILHLISLFHGRSIEPILPLLLLFILFLHVAQLLILISPSFIRYLYVYDAHLSLTFKYLVITLALLVAYISFSVHSKLFSLNIHLTSGLRNLATLFVIFVFVIVIPGLSIVATYLFTSPNGSKCALKSSIPIAVLTLYVPISASGLITLCYCICTVRRGLALKRRLRYTGEEQTPSTAMVRIALSTPILFMLLLTDTFFFVHNTSFTHVVILSASHILLSLLLFVMFISFLAMRIDAAAQLSGTRTGGSEEKPDISRGELLPAASKKSLVNGEYPFASNSFKSLNSHPYHIFQPRMVTFEKPIVTIV